MLAGKYSLKNKQRYLVVGILWITMFCSMISPVQGAAPIFVPKSELDEVLYTVLLDVYNQSAEPDIAFGDPIPGNSFEQVEQLYLINKGISSLRGLDRFSFADLKELSLSGNRLTSLAGFPASLPALEILSLSNNRLNSLRGLPNSLSKLKELNLSGNLFSSLGTLPQELPKLNILDLSENELTGPQAFAGIPTLPELSELSITDNVLTSLTAMPPAARIPLLEVLEVGSNQITTLAGMPDYTALPLEICDLSNNQVTTLVGFAQLRSENGRNNASVLTLNLGGNNIDLSSSQNQALAQDIPGIVFVTELGVTDEEDSNHDDDSDNDNGNSSNGEGNAGKERTPVTNPAALTPGGDNTLYNQSMLQLLTAVTAQQREGAGLPEDASVADPNAPGDRLIILTALDGMKIQVPRSALAGEMSPLKFRIGVGGVTIPPKAIREAVVLNPLKYQRQLSVEGKTEGSVQFSAPVTLSFLIGQDDLPAGLHLQQLSIFEWDSERGDWIKRGGVFDPLEKTISIPTYHLSTYAVMADTGATPQRISGFDRFETANAIAEQGWKAGADTVILANAYSFPDALAATPLAFKHHAPVLLTEAQSLTSSTKAQIERLRPKRIILVGGTAVISQAIKDSLSTQYGSTNVLRYAGVDRYATAAVIAQALGTTGQAVVLSGGEANYPDALAISSYAAYHGIPVLFTQGDGVPAATAQALSGQKVTSTIVIGGTSVVPEKVKAQLPGAVRYGGVDQYETACIIATKLKINLNRIYVATGQDFPDALVAGAYAAQTLSPILMVDEGVPSCVSDILGNTNSSITNLTVIGGESVIKPTQEALMRGYLH